MTIFQVAAKILQDTAFGKTYASDKVSLRFLCCQHIRSLKCIRISVPYGGQTDKRLAPFLFVFFFVRLLF